MFTLSRKKKRKVGKKKTEIHKNKIAISFLACVIFIPCVRFLVIFMAMINTEFYELPCWIWISLWSVRSSDGSPFTAA